MKKLLLLILTVIASSTIGMSAADEVLTLDFSKQGYTNRQSMPNIQLGDVTITPEKGSKNTLPQYYPAYNSMVFYATNYMTISCATKSIARIEFTTFAQLPMERGRVRADAGAIIVNSTTSAEWSNNRSVSTLTISPKFNSIIDGVGIQVMKIYLTDRPAEATLAATPAISPDDALIYKETNISISTETPEATIHYTTDGSNPVPGGASTSKYTGPFSIDKSSVVKAIAVANGMETSNIGARGFDIPIECDNIAALLANAQDGVAYTLTNSTMVSFGLGSTCWITDESGCIKLFGDAIANARPSSGDKLSVVTGTFNLDRNTPELEYVRDETFRPTPSGSPYPPTEKKVSEITADHINNYIIVKGVTLTRSTSDPANYTMTDDSGTRTLRNNYNIAIDASLIGIPVDVELFPAYYNSEVRLYPVRVTDPNAEPEPDPEPEVRPGNGSYSYPYTVAEAELAQDNQTFEAGIWVKGYIVGTFPNPYIGAYGTPTFGTDNASDLTLILADQADCTDFDKCMKVCYLSGNVKTDINLKNNPEALGKYVAICGNMSSYYMCLQMPTEYEFRTPPASSGIEAVEAADTDAPVRYYNLQGQPVGADNLRQGQIYIRQQGDKATKILVR